MLASGFTVSIRKPAAARSTRIAILEGGMKILVTGSAGHLGDALMRTLPLAGHEPVGLDIKESPFTSLIRSITDRSFVKMSMRGMDAVIHTATLHKPHVATHS